MESRCPRPARTDETPVLYEKFITGGERVERLTTAGALPRQLPSAVFLMTPAPSEKMTNRDRP